MNMLLFWLQQPAPVRPEIMNSDPPIPAITSIRFACTGVVGLAVAAEISKGGRSVLLLERNGRPGQETSSRNSEGEHYSYSQT